MVLILFVNYCKIAVRNLLRHKVYSFINIFGLALGIACGILIFLWVQDEMSIDRFHEKKDGLYTIRTWQQYGSERHLGSGSPPAVGPALKAEYPEIIEAARFQNGQGEALVTCGDIRFRENIQMADPEIFRLFTFPFVAGNPEEAFSGMYVMVISKSVADKYFGETDPLGRIVTLNHQYDFKIVGVMQDIPQNSIFGFDIWIPLEFTRVLYRQNFIDTWYNLAFRTYVEIQPGADYELINEKIKDRIIQSHPETILEPVLYPFKDIYMKMWGRAARMNLFIIIAVFILAIACINFMNLTTARSSQRAREVGLRKVVGAQRGQLIRQHLGEAVLLTMAALIAAIFMVELFMPTFRQMVNKPLELNYLGNSALIIGTLAIAIVTGLLAGSYPAFILAAFKPVYVMKGALNADSRSTNPRKVLVVLQFTISIILIVSTAVVYLQIHYMKNKSLGFEKEHIIHIPIEGSLKDSYESVKSELLQRPGILNVTVSSHSPTGVYWNGQDWEWEGRDPNVNPLVTYLNVDHDFTETFRIQMTQGRFFKPELTGRRTEAVINESFTAIMGMESPVGKTLSNWSTQYKVIGVVQDFHFKPVHRRIEPLIIVAHPEIYDYKYIFIRTRPDNLSETIAYIKRTVEKFNPEFPFEYHFLDEEFERLYRGTERFNGLISSFALLAILISSLGLFGLASFSAERHTKEIGVRKVLGATVSSIVGLLSREFLILVGISNLIAWPLAYFLMSIWLQNFAFRIGLGSWLWIFPAAALAVCALALLTVSFQSIKAATANPVESLRYE